MDKPGFLFCRPIAVLGALSSPEVPCNTFISREP